MVAILRSGGQPVCVIYKANSMLIERAKGVLKSVYPHDRITMAIAK